MSRMSFVPVVFILAACASAQLGGTGAGIIVGEPTGLCLKSWLSETTAISAGAAWSLDEHEGLYLFADYLLHSLDIVDDPGADLYGLMFTYGLGGRISFREKDPDPGEDGEEDEVVIGARIPLGLCYPFEGAPIDIFVEGVPGMDVVPETDFVFAGGIGARLYF